MQRNVIETVMGAVVLIVAGLFLAFAYNSSGYGTKDDRIQYHASFDRVDGIVAGGDVRLSGVKVGIVREININPKTYLAELKFDVDKKIPLPQDSSAEIISDGLMGGKYLALVPGGDEEILKPGDQIEHTQSSVSLEGMIGQLIFNSRDPGKKENSSKTHPHP